MIFPQCARTDMQNNHRSAINPEKAVDHLRAASEDRMGTLAPDFASAFPVATSSHAAGRSLRATTQAFPGNYVVKSRKFALMTGAAAGTSCITKKTTFEVVQTRWQQQSPSSKRRMVCYAEETNKRQVDDSTTGIQLYSQIEKLITETARQSQDAWGGSGDWSEIEGAWVLKPKSGSPKVVVHFVGGIFVGAAPQLTYRLFLERLSKRKQVQPFPCFLLSLSQWLKVLVLFYLSSHRLHHFVVENLLIKFKDDTIDETPTLAQLLSGGSAISSQLDMSVRLMPGDHGLPLQQILPDIPPAMADAVNRGGEILSNLTAGTPWEAVAREVGSTLGTDSGIVRAQISKDIDALADLMTSWMDSNSGPRLIQS
ncbi:hypothetical protein MUK42_23713 [Musa troglodytarum]|uniref:Uncharacterized protein n=1 Tax=Musa troglodytarum TaxID=320322 RepID=A0A9E7KCE9_9LILI|nr:hypothetical protein MUK42_23713 [Musa troglodytarum]